VVKANGLENGRTDIHRSTSATRITGKDMSTIEGMAAARFENNGAGGSSCRIAARGAFLVIPIAIDRCASFRDL
jgi:hypothetical protein